MMEVEQPTETLNAAAVLAAILDELSAVTDYRTLRDTLPRRLASQLRCRCILLYQRVGETLQFASGSFDDKPGWSTALLAFAHINPVDLNSDTLEAAAWRTRHAVTAPAGSPNPPFVAVPLIYRQRAIGVLVAIRGENIPDTQPLAVGQSRQHTNSLALASWSSEDAQVVEAAAGVIAMLLENARLLERDRERIRELSLLNSISRQLNSSIHELERVQSIVIQRTKEISTADLCDLLHPSSPPGAISWVTPALQEMLLRHFGGHSTLNRPAKEASPLAMYAQLGHKERESRLAPLVIERPGDAFSSEYVSQLAAQIKTFFAIPLFRVGSRFFAPTSSLAYTHGEEGTIDGAPMDEGGPGLLGIVVGAYQRPWKLRREEIDLLQVLANQASVVLENISLMQDVVEARNEARKLLRQVLDDQRLKELILESMPGGLITVDVQGRITTFNRTAQAILGYHPFEVMGQPGRKIFAEHLFENVTQSGQPRRETLLVADRNGQQLVLDATFLPLWDDQGKLIGTLLTFTDVTTMHRLEEEKRRLDRLASLGEMAASVAHEVRNPLASIKTSMQMLIDDLARDNNERLARDEGLLWNSEGAQESVAVVLNEVERLDTIVRDLLLFSRPRQLHLVECNLVELCERVLQFIEPQCIEADVEVHRVYHDVPPVRVDVAQMEQVILNLCLNALQAMPDGGVLTLSCQVTQALPGEQRVSSSRGPGSVSQALLPAAAALPTNVFNRPHRWLELSVSDTGAGIAPDQLERIFQPFFTTKAHGIGLGLPISRRLVEDHHGHMLVESQLGYGATFIARLPLQEGEGRDSWA